MAQPGDIGVAGDWTGDGKSKIGIYRPSTGTWYLDANNNGIFDAGDYTYQFGGIAGDLPVVGDWMAAGRSCIGIARTGGFWLLDLNCNGTFDNTPTDAFFPFGGLTGDVPVVGNWVLGQGTRVGMVRKYAPGGVPQGSPFLWVLDGNAANAGNQPANHSVATAANLARSPLVVSLVMCMYPATGLVQERLVRVSTARVAGSSISATFRSTTLMTPSSNSVVLQLTPRSLVSGK